MTDDIDREIRATTKEIAMHQERIETLSAKLRDLQGERAKRDRELPDMLGR